jgi:hypothetical protein
MSTLLYEGLTNTREAAKADTPVATAVVTEDGSAVSKPVSKLVDVVAALVPVEVLAAHAALMGAVSQSSNPADDGPVQVIITDETWATRFWVALLVVAIALYAIPHVAKHGWDRWDVIRALIPAAAFAAWTILQKSTLFDAVTDWDNLQRIGIGTFLALGAVIASKTLADTAQEKTPPSAQAKTLGVTAPEAALAPTRATTRA